jgi:hypothetical protein
MAQTDYRSGYIITLSDDTIYGEIDYRGDLTMGRICCFKSTDGEKSEFTPDNLKAYRFIDSKYYVSRTINQQKHFFEFLIKGMMNIYYLRDNEGDHYYMDKEGTPLVEIPYKEDFRMSNGKEYLHKSTVHIGILNNYSEDAPQLKDDIKKIKEPTHQNLIKLAKNYHSIVCTDDEECVIFERPGPLFRIGTELVAGGYNFLAEGDERYKNIISAGAKIYFWLPRVNENLYFKTGILYFGNTTISTIKIPLQLEYVYPKGLFRPVFSGGVNLYDGYIPFPAYSIGLLMKSKKDDNLSFLLAYELETDAWAFPLVFIPSWRIAGHSLSFGVRYTF